MLCTRLSYSGTDALSVCRLYRRRKLNSNRRVDIAGKKIKFVLLWYTYLTVQQGEESSAIGEHASMLLLTTSEEGEA